MRHTLNQDWLSTEKLKHNKSKHVSVTKYTTT